MDREPTKQQADMSTKTALEFLREAEPAPLTVGMVLAWAASALLPLVVLAILIFAASYSFQNPKSKPDLLVPDAMRSGKPGRTDYFDPNLRSRFFGVGNNAHIICYVIDQSDPSHTHLNDVAAELIRSINALRGDQFCQAILFNSDEPEHNPQFVLGPVNEISKDYYADFYCEAYPKGKDSFYKAIERAFKVTNQAGDRVQLIYLLSTGDLPADAGARINLLNPEKKVIINTISFVSDRSRTQLENIADDNWGQYKFFTEKDWKYYINKKPFNKNH